ncbi:Zinc-containing alcohol dehydrogenase superfamily protein [Pseudomonas fluorescens]|uniref:Zinc-containing alcohol dehydrogenase superfamily protein n=1 Tax=Pseudomonas fluorescens TaxID=294 RepID=A0A3S4T285_PSEFL|nr:Zinc-containing alcohol dehydrogenase superfamily protein [Pseudomonas fluorescens]
MIAVAFQGGGNRRLNDSSTTKIQRLTDALCAHFHVNKLCTDLQSIRGRTPCIEHWSMHVHRGVASVVKPQSATLNELTLAGKVDPAKLLTLREPLSDAISAFAAFDCMKQDGSKANSNAMNEASTGVLP